MNSLPKADWMLADRDYQADWFREALQNKGITPCIPGRKSRSKPVKYDKRRYKRRNRIEIMFGRLRTGGALQPAMTGAKGVSVRHRTRSNRHVLALIEERLLTLMGATGAEIRAKKIETDH